MSLARTICDDLKDNAERFCRCCIGCWTVKGCIATAIAVLLPASFVIQLTALLLDKWAFKLNCTNSDEYDFNSHCNYGCFDNGEYSDVHSCAIEIVAVTLEGLLLLYGVCVCSRTCCSHFDARSCRFCYVCFIPVIILLPGTFSIACCLITAKFASDHHFSCGISFYMFLVTGCTLIAVSLAVPCGYICSKSCTIQSDNQLVNGSDDDETRPILHTRQPVPRK